MVRSRIESERSYTRGNSVAGGDATLGERGGGQEGVPRVRERRDTNRQFALGALPGTERARVHAALAACPESDYHVAAESERSARLSRENGKRRNASPHHPRILFPRVCRKVSRKAISGNIERENPSPLSCGASRNAICNRLTEGQLPKGAAYLEQSESSDHNRPPSDERPLISPGEISEYFPPPMYIYAYTILPT